MLSFLLILSLLSFQVMKCCNNFLFNQENLRKNKMECFLSMISLTFQFQIKTFILEWQLKLLSKVSLPKNLNLSNSLSLKLQILIIPYLIFQLRLYSVLDKEQVSMKFHTLLPTQIQIIKITKL